MDPEGYLQRLFDLLLKLYPRRFQERFGEEMRAVFADLMEQGRPRGKLALLGMFLRELITAPGSVAGSYRLMINQRRREMDDWTQGPAVPFEPAGSQVDRGRRSWREVILELALFILVGGTLLINTYLLPYLPGGSVRTAALIFSLAPAILSIPILLAGLARGMPRWAYPSAGLLLGYLFIAGMMLQIMPLLAILALGSIAGSIALALFTALAQRRWHILPESMARLCGGLTQDWSRLSFGFYGLMPLAITVAFDDGFVNYRTPFLVASVLLMLAGALVFSLSRRPALQYAALLAGISGMVCMALLDRAYSGYGLQESGWLLRLWGNLALLALAPMALELISRQKRAARPL